MRFVAVLALPLAQLFDDLLAAVRATQVHNLIVVEDHLYKATNFVEFGVGRTAEGQSFGLED